MIIKNAAYMKKNADKQALNTYTQNSCLDMSNSDDYY